MRLFPCPNTSRTEKTSPQDLAVPKSETNFRPENGGVLRESSRREGEVWRGRDASFKRRPFPSKVFYPSHLARFGHGERIKKLVQQLVVNQLLLAHQILDAAVFA